MEKEEIIEKIKQSTNKYSGNNSKCYIFGDHVVLVSDYPYKVNVDTSKLIDLGVNSCLIYKNFSDENKHYLEQSFVQGEPLFYRDKNRFYTATGLEDNEQSFEQYKKFSLNKAEQYINDVPQEHFDKLVKDVIISKLLGLSLEFRSDNFLYSPKTGFGIIDLPLTQTIDEEMYLRLKNKDVKINNIIKDKSFFRSSIKNSLTSLFTSGGSTNGKAFLTEEQKKQLTKKCEISFKKYGIVLDNSLEM